MKHRRDTVEQLYTRILNSEFEWTWDIYRTVECFLDFLGKNPIGKTRYPCNRSPSPEHRQAPGIWAENGDEIHKKRSMGSVRDPTGIVQQRADGNQTVSFRLHGLFSHVPQTRLQW